MAYDNTNSGLLAKNTRKEKDTHPAYTGSINIEGRDYWISAWVKEGREGTKLEGQKYFSLSVKPKDEQPQQQQRRPEQRRPEQQRRQESRPATSFDDMEDDIPF